MMITQTRWLALAVLLVARRIQPTAGALLAYRL